MQWLIDFLSRVLAWFLSAVTWVVIKVCKLLFEGLLSLLQAIPVPEWFSNATSYFSNIPPSVGYILSAFQITFGIEVVLGALLIRFLIRRLPFIG